MEECHTLLTDQVDNAILRYNVSKPLPLGADPGHVTIQLDFFFNKDLEYLRYGRKMGRPALSISKMKAAYYPDVGLKQMVPDQMWIEEECKYDVAAMYGISHWWFQRQRFYIDRHTYEGDCRAVRTHMRILSVIRIEVFLMYGYNYMKKIVLCRADLKEYCGILIWPSIEENEVIRPKKYSELSVIEALQADCDIKATNIILQGLPPKVYALVSNHKVARELWEIIQLPMQGTSLTKQERECKLYDEFDKFAYKKGESLHEFYLRFSLLLNDMNIYNMKLEQFQVNTMFLNTLPLEWSKFVTDVKLVRDLHTTNIDQPHAYLGQHEFHENEVRLMHERNSDPLALVATHQMTQSPYQTHQNSH
ncbi:hypothetical protein Tco_1377697 [Tanacetum coccineum]